MSLLTIRSSNPNLSFILCKNPATIWDSGKPFSKPIRKGHAYGWFPKDDSQTFKLLFKDAPNETSFVQGFQADFEYLDQSRYSSPYLPISLVTHCLRDAASKRVELDADTFSTTVEFLLKVANPNFFSSICRSLSQSISVDLLDKDRLYKVVITESTVFRALNVLYVLCMTQAVFDDDLWLPNKDADVAKYVTALNNIGAGFYPRSIIARAVLKSPQQFDRFKDQINTEDMSIVPLNTQLQRMGAVRKHLTGGQTLADIGCGEMYYSLKMSKAYDLVFAFDADEELTEINKRKVEVRQVPNVTPLGKVDQQFVDDNKAMFDGADILLTEVIEHMAQSEAILLIMSLLDTDFNKFVITTPNGEFNQFYHMEPGSMRHHDHEWETNMAGFQGLISSALRLHNETRIPREYEIVYEGIGDSVKGIHTSSLAVITIKKEA